MHDLEVSYRKIADFCQLWMDKVAAANVENAAVCEQLRMMTEREARLQEEVSRLTADLQSSGAELRSVSKHLVS